MKKKILIADDDDDIRLLVATKLRQSGYDVLSSKEGADALAKIRGEKPDLIIVDYYMPGLLGDEICRAVKADAELRHIPIILVSASMAALSPEAVRLIPCEDQMSKPFDIAALLEKIRLFL